MTDKQIRDRIMGALSVSMMPMEMEAECVAFLDRCMDAALKKPLTAFLAPIDPYEGLKRKFLVFKSDTGEMVENCFVLRPGKDPTAVEALRAYARATDNQTLAGDIYNWVGTGEQDDHRWIPVTERLPEKYQKVIVYRDGIVEQGCKDVGDWWKVYGTRTKKVTHWMPMPSAEGLKNDT